MKKDFIKFADDEYVFTDEFGKINEVKSDISNDHVLLRKEKELEIIERENILWIDTISKVTKKEGNNTISSNTGRPRDSHTK